MCLWRLATFIRSDLTQLFIEMSVVPNVLMEPQPNRAWKAKLSDYGSVNLMNKLATAWPGNVVYAAPEAQSPPLQTPKMDIFSLGILLVEIFTGRFPDFDVRETLIQSINDVRVVELIRECINEDQERRPTATVIITRLREL